MRCRLLVISFSGFMNLMYSFEISCTSVCCARIYVYSEHKTYLYNAHAPLSAADDNIKKTQFNITIRRKDEQIESAHKHDWIWINDNMRLFP